MRETLSPAPALKLWLSVLQAFVSHYYQTFDTNRAQLVGLYQNESMLTWEGQQIRGASDRLPRKSLRNHY